jgi:hypothetical protein
MFTEDWDVFFSEFGRDAHFQGKTIRVLFDHVWVDQMGVDGARPALHVRDEVKVKNGDYITLTGWPGSSFRVVSIQPDNGLKQLLLERVEFMP